MLSFRHYLKVRESVEEGSPLDDDNADITPGILKAVHIAHKEQPDRLLSFLKNLGIQEINDILDQSNTDELNKSARPQFKKKSFVPNSGDEVVAPSFADNASSELS
jgi:hypothetical protein